MKLAFNRRLDLSSIVTNISTGSSTRFTITLACRASFTGSPRGTSRATSLRCGFAVSEAIKQVVNALCCFRCGSIGLFLGIGSFFRISCSFSFSICFSLSLCGSLFFRFSSSLFLSVFSRLLSLSSSLFFANIDILQQDIENAIGSDTKAVILDASGIGSIDVTAADRLAILYRSLKSRGIRFYITEHIAELNEQMRALGLEFMIEEGRVRRTIHVALKDMGIHYPYPLKGNVDNTERSPFRKRVDISVQ